MERESFSDPEVAAALNEHFICIKLDREERPDLDQFFMDACVAFTGQGGWPLTLALTPEGLPFFAASYIPRERRFQSPGILDVIAGLAAYWRDHREDAVALSREVTRNLSQARQIKPRKPPHLTDADQVYRSISSRFDPVYGGFGTPPKFPLPHLHLFLLRYGIVSQKEHPIGLASQTLLAMARGGIYDHLGGGFHRYSTDEKWLVPHFEKMLYDQALCALAYGEAFAITGETHFANVAAGCMDYICRDLQAPGGGFFAGEDAESEGEEGRYYTWTWDEISAALSPQEREVASQFLFIAKKGQDSPTSGAKDISRGVLAIVPPPQRGDGIGRRDTEEQERAFAQVLEKLFLSRRERVRPACDDLILADWNGLALSALAVTSRVLRTRRFLEAAEKAARFILENMRMPDGGLYHRWWGGTAAIPGMSGDYACMVMGLSDLYFATGNPMYFAIAVELEEYHASHFWDRSEGGYFMTAEGRDDTIVRQKEFLDGSVPSSNSISFTNLLRLFHVTGESRYEERAEKISGYYAELMTNYPLSCGMYLAGLLLSKRPCGTVTLTGNPESPLFKEMRRLLDTWYSPFLFPVFLEKGSMSGEVARVIPAWTNLSQDTAGPVALICLGHSCREPVVEAGTLEAFLKNYSGRKAKTGEKEGNGF